MRRRGHPSRPRAITCCFFASLKTLLISTKAKCLTPKSTSRASFSLAGFQVTLIGRFWVTPEEDDGHWHSHTHLLCRASYRDHSAALLNELRTDSCTKQTKHDQAHEAEQEWGYPLTNW